MPQENSFRKPSYYFYKNSLVRQLLLIVGWAASIVACTSHSENVRVISNKVPPVDSVALRYNPEDAYNKSQKIDSFFRDLHRTKGFNGTALVAQYGRMLYKGAFGFADMTTKDSLTTKTAFQLASVSKQFTAMAIMILHEAGKLHYDDDVQKFFPQFPYACITIRQLLTHRSGLPNYAYFCDAHITDRVTPISNAKVMEMLIAHSPMVYYQPDKRFDYSNTGYFLLAAIVEKASGMSFKKFMEQNVFRPLQMNRTFVYDGSAFPSTASVATGYTSGRREDQYYLNGVMGDKGVYSTVEDMFRWDQALYTEKLVKQRTLAEAFMPAHKELKKQNYGFGWRLQTLTSGDSIAFHAGWWKGFKAYFLHNPHDQSAIIVLSNRSNYSLSFLKNLEAILYPSALDTVDATVVRNGDAFDEGEE